MSRTLRLCRILIAVSLLGMAARAPAQTAGVSTSAQIVLTPNSGTAGQTLTVTLSGVKCRPDYRYAFEPGGITASALPCAQAALAAAPASMLVTISPKAQAGAYALVITGRDMVQVRVPDAFTVRPTAPPAGRTEGAAPRVDRVNPQDLTAGGTFTLTLYGSGFSQGMAVDFGRGIQVLSPPVLQEPMGQRAQVQVLVLPTALEGVRLAEAKNTSGQRSRGPGGVRVLPAASGAAQPPKVVRTQPPKIEIPVPSGKIFLRAPNITGSGEFVSQHMADDPPLVQQGTQFTWFEQNPGVAQYYVLTIKDKQGKVLAQVQTPASKNYYRVTKQLLLSLPTYTPELAFHYMGPKGPNMQTSQAGVSLGATGPGGHAQSQAPISTGLPQGHGGSSVTQAQINTALAMAKETGGLTSMVDPDLHLIKPTDHADATWSVTGYWKHPLTHEDMAVETSEDYPLRFPRQPKGMLTCDAADQPGALDVACVDPKDPNSSRACLVGNTVVLSGAIRLDRDPYPTYVTLHNFQDHAAQYSNVYLSWGDGEVTPLLVDMTPSGEPVVKIQYMGKGLEHVYTEPGPYLIKIYSLPNAETSNPVLAASASSVAAEQQAFRSGMPGVLPGPNQGQSQAASASMKVNASGPRGASSAGSGLSGASSANPPAMSASPVSDVASALANDAYLIACVPVNPQYPEDMVASGPLNLVKIAVTGFPGHAEKPPQVPQVKDCSQGFRAEATLTYFGQGQVGWTWVVDGVEIPGGTRKIGPGGGAHSTATEVLTSDPLPVVLAAEPHTLSVKAWVVLDFNHDLLSKFSAAPGFPFQSVGGRAADTPSGAAGSSGQMPVQYLALRPNQQSFASLGAVVSASSQGSSTSPKAQGRVQASAGTGSEVFVTAGAAYAQAIPNIPAQKVASPNARYQVVQHDPSTPCSLLFETAKGPFVITDLGDDFAQQADGTYNGSGSLVLALPEGQSGTEKVLVPVTFKGWTLEGAGDGRTVTKGALDVKPNNALDVVGLTGKLSALSGQAGTSAGEVSVTFALEPSSFSLLKGTAGSLIVQAKGPITPEGDFRAEGLSLPLADLGYSGYQITATKAVLDLSRSEGDPPDETACNATGTGAQWVGLLLQNGTLKTGNISLVPVPLPDVPFKNWSVGPGGLSGRITGYPLNGTVPMGLATIKVSTFDFFVCGNSLDSTFALSINDYPFINGPLSGKTTIDIHGVSKDDIAVAAVNKDFGTIHYKSSSGSFGFEQGVGWRLVLNGTFRFNAFTKPFYDGLPLSGLQVLPTGELRLDGGAHSQHIALGAWGTLGQVTADVTGADVTLLGFGSKRALAFDLTAGFHLSTTLSVTPSVIHYKLKPVQGQDGHFSADDPAVDDLHIENHYPYNSDVNMSATISYQNVGSGNTRFSGNAQLQLMSGTVNAEFLLGYQNGQDYWLTRVGYNMGTTPVPILGPFLALYEVHGALGHNINFAQAAQGLPIGQIQPSFDGGYLFQAGCQVGDNMAGGWIYYFDGTFTVDTKQGARIDAKGWLLTSDHSGAAPLNGTLQYGGGSFTASLTASLSYLDGAVTISGGVNILIGNNWHIWLGTDTQPVSTHVLVADCTGFLMLDDNGLRIGGGYSSHFHANPSLWGCGVYIDFDFSCTLNLAVSKDATYGIHFEGAFHASVNGSAGVSLPVLGNVGINLGGGLDLTASAMPVHVCGDLWLDFGCACFCPCSWRHPFTFHCCCKCFKTSFGVCLP
jgi:hypothetical protein